VKKQPIGSPSVIILSHDLKLGGQLVNGVIIGITQDATEPQTGYWLNLPIRNNTLYANTKLNY